MYSKASKWLKQLEEDLSGHSHTCEGSTSSREREVLSTMMGKQRFSKTHPGPYKNEMTFLCCFPSFSLRENTKCWAVGFSFVSFILSMPQLLRHTLYFSLFSSSQQWRGEIILHTAFKPGCISIVPRKKMARFWDRWFPPPLVKIHMFLEGFSAKIQCLAISSWVLYITFWKCQNISCRQHGLSEHLSPWVEPIYLWSLKSFGVSFKQPQVACWLTKHLKACIWAFIFLFQL